MKAKLFMLIITLLLLAARLTRLDTPPFQYFDEYYSAYSAVRWVEGDRSFYDFQRPSPNLDEGAYVRFHPPGGMLLTALGVLVFGDTPLGWRAMSVGAGLLLIWATAMLAKHLTSHRIIPLVAAFLMSVENLTFFHSRVGTIDIFVVAAIVVAAWLSLAWQRKQTLTRASLAGLGWGLALSVKWSAVIPWLVVFGYLVFTKVGWKKLLLAMVILPLAIYLFIFSLFLTDGLGELTGIHRTIIHFHLSGFNETASTYILNQEMARSWWEWPFFYRPVRYLFQAVLTKQSAFLRTVNIVPNIAITFFLPLAVGAALIRSRLLKSLAVKQGILKLILALFLTQWLVWAASPRPTYLYYFLPAIPFGTIVLAVWLGWLWQQQKKVLVVSYLFLALGFFALHYPWLAALPVPLKLWSVF